MTDGWSGTPNLPAVATPVGTVAEPGRSLARDGSGRFLSGNSGGGRPKGARSRLKETFLATVADHFAEHGKAVFDRLAAENPEAYARIMASIVPREPTRDEFGDLSDDEIVEVVGRAERHRFVQRMIEAGEKNT